MIDPSVDPAPTEQANRTMQKHPVWPKAIINIARAFGPKRASRNAESVSTNLSGRAQALRLRITRVTTRQLAPYRLNLNSRVPRVNEQQFCHGILK